jgi:hypothetical protein
MRFKLPTALRPLEYPAKILDFFKALFSRFLLLLVIMSLADLVAYRTEYTGKEKQATTITVDAELLNRIDQYRAEKGLDSRPEAIDHLLDRVLTENEEAVSKKSPSDTVLDSQ